MGIFFYKSVVLTGLFITCTACSQFQDPPPLPFEPKNKNLLSSSNFIPLHLVPSKPPKNISFAHQERLRNQLLQERERAYKNSSENN